MTELRSVNKTKGTSSALERGKAYALLSTVFLKQPDPELVGFYRDASRVLKDFPGLQRIESYLNDTRERSAKEVSEELSASFTRLFRGTIPLIPPPYESVYKGEQLFGKTTSSVLQKYRSFGMELGEEYTGEPPDYLGFELDFMRFLCERETKAREEGDLENIRNILEAEKRFLEEHLLTWIERFSDIVRRYVDKGFYQGWVDFTKNWLSQDYKNLRNLIRGAEI
jgi:TorA maturation chaperone TorD